MRRLKHGGGGSKRPKNRKQAIAIGLSEARERGARIVTGAQRTGRATVRPTILADVPADARISREEAFARLEQISGREVPRDDTYLSPATHPQWVSRILSNLQTLFANQGKQKDLAAMTELQEALADTLH